MSAAIFTTRYRVIVLDPDSNAILALPADGGWRLPGWESTEPRNWEDVAPVNAQLLKTLGLRLATLRAVALDWSDDRRNSYYLAELLDPGWQPRCGATWLPITEVSGLRWAEPQEAAQVAAWLAERPDERRVPWYNPGWFRVAGGWIVGALEAAGLELASPIAQLRSWQRCSLFRASTSAGDAYFKAVPPQWGHEPALTAYLAGRFPALSPTVLASGVDQGYLLLADFGGRPLADVDDPEAWTVAYAALGRMQRELADDVDVLSGLGVPIQGPAEILPRIGLMLRDERRLRAGMEHGLEPGQVALLHAAEPDIIAACERLATGPIPLSLDHGDFWPGNIRWTDAGPLIFDWSDATITHPFFSLVMAADEIDGALPAHPDLRQRVIDAYLDVWTGFAPLDELRAIFADAMLVAPLHQVLMYRDVYLPALEFIDELDRMPVVYLGWLAQQLADDS